jgi:hypothetical protein
VALPIVLFSGQSPLFLESIASGAALPFHAQLAKDAVNNDSEIEVKRLLHGIVIALLNEAIT